VNIVLYTAGDNGGAWVAALARALPEARVDGWPGAEAADADYALVWRPPTELLGALRRSKAVFNLGAGVDGIADCPGLPSGVPLVRLENAGMAEQMAEYACHAVLRRYREFDEYAEQQRAAVWHPRRRIDKRAFGVGILGLGVLGEAVARALAPFGFPLSGWSRGQKSLPGVTTYAGAGELDAFLGGVQVLICLLPLTRETRGLLDRRLLSRLPRGAYLVNIARGPILIGEDLLALLDDGHLGGAMLDVFHDEPLPATHPFWHHPRVTVTPHISAATLIDESVAQIAEKIRRLEAGLPVSGIVARDRGY
jgi:glyoxylate/hydroxypyruvate reductase A